MAATVPATAVRVTVLTLTTIAVLSTCSCHHPAVGSSVETTVTFGESNPGRSIYQINVVNHISISFPSQVAEKPETDTPHDCGYVPEDYAEMPSYDNPKQCNCVLKDDAEKPVVNPHGTPIHCCPCCCQWRVRKNAAEKTTRKPLYRQSYNYRRSVYGKQFALDSYKLHDSPMTWSEAKKTCEQEGSHLLVINSKAEEELVKKVMGRHRRLFIGLRYLKQPDYYETVLGERVNSTLSATWSKEAGSCGSREMCGTLWFTGEVAIASCNERRAFICELPAQGLHLHKAYVSAAKTFSRPQPV